MWNSVNIASRVDVNTTSSLVAVMLKMNITLKRNIIGHTSIETVDSEPPSPHCSLWNGVNTASGIKVKPTTNMAAAILNTAAVMLKFNIVPDRPQLIALLSSVARP
jgi:hypothetical protein